MWTTCPRKKQIISIKCINIVDNVEASKKVGSKNWLIFAVCPHK